LNTYGWQWTTIAALIAPRPLLFVNSDNDKIFPMDGNRRIIERLRKVYKMCDKPDLVDDYVSKGGHDYRPDLRVAVFKFLNKHLKNETGEVKDADFTPLPGKELRVFPEDKDVPADALNGKIDETFVARAVVKLPDDGNYQEWRKALLTELRERSFRSFPADIPPVKDVKRPSPVGEMSWLVTEPGIEILGTPVRKTGEPKALVLLGDDAVKDLDFTDKIGPFLGRDNYWILSPRGAMETEWTIKSPPNYVERSHALLGRTVDEGRVWDIIATAKHLKKEYKPPVRVIGRGRDGILAVYAALLEPSIEEVILLDPPASHKDGPIFLNVMRVLDVPDALGMLAPRKLTLVNAKDKAFDKTAEIYKIAGAADKFERK
jgi:hypothetical protein